MFDYFDDPDYVVAVIGAGRGIGHAAAREMASQGVAVACLDSDGANARETAQSIAAAGGRSTAAALDVTDGGLIATALAATVRELGRIDGLVNCAGITGRTNVPG
ncbi:MAG TPA: SDR family NAD(P)-dependent oxidoreductase, partial [Dongiaceae bacterium]|nr:SDR family NAD(P)-dependent oxidoreductase [Dongiaceae bacterium]